MHALAPAQCWGLQSEAGHAHLKPTSAPTRLQPGQPKAPHLHKRAKGHDLRDAAAAVHLARLRVLNGRAQQVGGTLARLITGALDQDGAGVAVHLWPEGIGCRVAAGSGWRVAAVFGGMSG